MKKFKVNRPLYVLETRKENNDAVEAKVVESPIKMVEEVKKSEETSNRSNFWKFVAVMAVVVIAIAVFAIGCDKTADESKVSGTWQMSASDYGQNRWFSDGVQEIKDAKTDAEAADAAQAWLEKVKLDPALLAGASVYFLDEKVDSSTLVKDGWATKDAVELYGRLAVAIGMARVEVSEAPTTGYNSGVNDGQVVSAANSGISGDRKAVLVVLEDGTKVWLLGRCGNAVKPNKPNIPTGPTDEKDPTKDVLVNPDVDGWKQNTNGEKATADPEDFQADPVADAEKAADDAAVAADKAADAADDARDEAIDSGAGVVDSGEGYGEVEDPTVIDPNW